MFSIPVQGLDKQAERKKRTNMVAKMSKFVEQGDVDPLILGYSDIRCSVEILYFAVARRRWATVAGMASVMTEPNSCQGRPLTSMRSKLRLLGLGFVFFLPFLSYCGLRYIYSIMHIVHFLKEGLRLEKRKKLVA